MRSKEQEEAEKQLLVAKFNWKQAVQSTFDLQKKPYAAIQALPPFDLLSDYPSFVIDEQHTLRNAVNRIELSIIKTYSKEIIRTGANRTRELHFFDLFSICTFPVQKDYGRSIIRTEHLIDKIADLFESCDLDYEEYLAFSRRYCCYSNHPELLKQGLSTAITDLFILYTDDLSVEFGFDQCMIKQRHSIQHDKDPLALINFALQLRALMR